jgi:hypothetical protein
MMVPLVNEQHRESEGCAVKRRHLIVTLVLTLAGLGALSAAPPAPTGRTVFLAGGLTDEQTVVLSANLAASRHPGVLLLDAPRLRPYLRAFLSAYRPDYVTAIGSFSEGQEDLRRALGGWLRPPLPAGQGVPEELWKELFPHAEKVVVCPPAPRRLLLQAAALAGTARAPLIVLRGADGEAAELRRRLAAWGTRKIYAAGTTAAAVRGLDGMNVVVLPDAEAVSDRRLEILHKPVPTLVLANPADVGKGRPGLSNLAPWVAVRRKAALLLTSDRGNDAAAVLAAALKEPGLERASNLILVADHRAIPPERRTDPLKTRSDVVEVEPPGPPRDEPFTFATGRLFNRDPAVVPLMLAQQELLVHAAGPRMAVVVGNPDGGLSLLETISRNTAKELRNAGYVTRSYYRSQGARDTVRRLLPEADIFLWEGHHSSLAGSYGVPRWTEPLRPSLVFLQSCLALSEHVAQPFLERGAVGVIGSPSCTFSATGGALTLAYFDALLYDHQSVGGALRQAKNFLLAYARLKEQRLGKASKLGGANVRSAWAFSLWGDPTVKLPHPEPPEDALPAVHTEARASHITLSLPMELYDKVSTDRYQAVLRPNGRLAGLVTKKEGDKVKTLVPMLFTEVRLPKAAGHKAPHLTCKVPADRWVFLWDARLGIGYLLVEPRRRDREEIRFHLAWEE